MKFENLVALNQKKQRGQALHGEDHVEIYRTLVAKQMGQRDEGPSGVRFRNDYMNHIDNGTFF